MNCINMKMLFSAVIAVTLLVSCSMSTKGTVAITTPIRTLENIATGEQDQLKISEIPKVIAIAQLSNSTSSIEAS